MEWSPFDGRRLACATSQHFGIIGNGRQYVLDIDPAVGRIVPRAYFDSSNGLFDCSWSEEADGFLISASGDGSIKLWDIEGPRRTPLRSYEEHTQEVYSVDWNLVSKDTFLSASWDNSIKLWSPNQRRSLQTFYEHERSIYSAIWSPARASWFASASADCTLKIWDVNSKILSFFFSSYN